MLNGIMFYTKIYRQIHGDRVSDRGNPFLNAKDTLQKNKNMTPLIGEVLGEIIPEFDTMRS